MMDNPSAWFSLVLSVVWPLVFLGLAAVSFFRFRVTAAGWCLGGSFLLLAVRLIAHSLLSRTLMDGFSFHGTPWAIFWIVSGVLAGIGYVGVAVGVFLIPRSLAHLSGR
ncbi:MAG: hypothetical protein JXQ27_00525 [Acidobacteria bacterium]|nr:hypothetical protein [Acidobacteriota bacterium]